MTPGQAIRRDWAAWMAAALGIVVLCVCFRQEIGAAMSVWARSTAYGHCWLVLPIAAWLFWERRGVLVGIEAKPIPWAALLGLPVALAWIASRWLGIMEGRQLAVVGFVLLLLLAALGWRLWWALSAAFLYLVFLVPFGAFITPVLQGFTAGFIADGLRVLDIPFEADTFQITIPEGVFYVAEACAGLRFLIAAIAFGVLYAVTMFHSPWRRLAFIAVSCVTPVIANGFRALGIVLLGHFLGSAQAGAADHLIYGWVFFSTVIVLLALAGLPFREQSLPNQQLDRERQQPSGFLPAALSCAAVLLAALAGPVLSSPGRGGQPVLVAPSASVVPEGCVAGTWSASGPVSRTKFTCQGHHVNVVTTVMEHGTDPADILSTARASAMAGLGDDNIDSEIWHGPAHGAPPWVLVRARDSRRLAAYAIQVGGVQGVGGLYDRMRILRDMLGANGENRPIAQAVTLDGGLGPEGALKEVLVGLAR